MFLELAEAIEETETSALLTGLVINRYICLFVMTQNTHPSDPSHTSLSQQKASRERVNNVLAVKLIYSIFPCKINRYTKGKLSKHNE